jgi:hypothetical protein
MPNTDEDPAPQPTANYMLVADLNCVPCSQLARTLQSICEGQLTIRSHEDPTLPEAIQVLLQSRFEPILCRGTGQKLPTWRGLRLRLQLARLVGPVRSTRLLRDVWGYTGYTIKEPPRQADQITGVSGRT